MTETTVSSRRSSRQWSVLVSHYLGPALGQYSLHPIRLVGPSGSLLGLRPPVAVLAAPTIVTRPSLNPGFTHAWPADGAWVARNLAGRDDPGGTRGDALDEHRRGRNRGTGRGAPANGRRPPPGRRRPSRQPSTRPVPSRRALWALANGGPRVLGVRRGSRIGRHGPLHPASDPERPFDLAFGHPEGIETRTVAGSQPERTDVGTPRSTAEDDGARVSRNVAAGSTEIGQLRVVDGRSTVPH